MQNNKNLESDHKMIVKYFQLKFKIFDLDVLSGYYITLLGYNVDRNVWDRQINNGDNSESNVMFEDNTCNVTPIGDSTYSSLYNNKYCS